MREKESKYRRILPASRNRSLLPGRAQSTDQQLKAILEASTAGYWLWNLATREIYLSDGWLASLGYSAADAAHHSAFLKSLLHPDDQPVFDSCLQSHLAGDSDSLDGEFRFRTKAGDFKWFTLRGRVSRRDKAGHPLAIVGAILDVPAPKTAQGESAGFNRQLSDIFEAAEDSIWVVDPIHFELLFFNRAIDDLMFRALGIRLRLGMRIEEISPADRLASWKEFYRRVLEEGKVSLEYRLLSNGETLHLVGHRLERNGKAYAICVCGHDISQQKAAEAALRKSEEKFSAAFRAAPMVLTLTSTRDHRYMEVNPAFEAATGYSREEVIGKTPFDLGIWVDPHQRTELVQEILRTGYFRNSEMEFRTKSGEIRQAQGSAALIEIEGEPCMLAVAVDITEQKRDAETLRDSEEMLRIAIESGPMYAFEWDFATDFVRRSQKSERILDLPPGGSAYTRTEFVERIHPDDREHYLRGINALSSANPGYKLTFRYVRRDQKTIWLEELGRATFEPGGRIRRIIGMASDVTDVRQSERALRELSGRLISSQEEERRRIARELHDHIGQELALLSVQAQRIDSGASDEEHTTVSDIHDLYRRIKEIATDVSKLSHRLHSSELDFLGLSVAAERLCRDFANQYGIDVDYQIRNLPRLDSGRALCFYRVLQESLQNVAKHSHATRVNVELRAIGSELVLRISDNGNGFDLDKVRFASGLGLLSMRERMKLIGGRLDITTDEGQGTSLVAVAGIPAASG